MNKDKFLHMNVLHLNLFMYMENIPPNAPQTFASYPQKPTQLPTHTFSFFVCQSTNTSRPSQPHIHFPLQIHYFSRKHPIEEISMLRQRLAVSLTTGQQTSDSRSPSRRSWACVNGGREPLSSEPHVNVESIRTTLIRKTKCT